MIRLTNRMRNINRCVNITKEYNTDEALMLLKKLASAKFIETVDVAVNLGIDARKSDQNIRGSVILPHGTGRFVRIAVLASGINAKIALAAGAELVGMEDLVDKIKSSKINFDVLIATPDAMNLVSDISQILGPRGLMPNSKFGTVTNNIGDKIHNFKTGQICYRNDKNGIVHAVIGKINFDTNKLKENFQSLLNGLKKAKPPSSKGVFFKKITLSTTMGVGVVIDQTKLSVSI